MVTVKGREFFTCGHREETKSDGQSIQAIVCDPGNYGVALQ